MRRKEGKREERKTFTRKEKENRNPKKIKREKGKNPVY